MPADLPSLKGHLPLAYRWFRANYIRRLVPWCFEDDPERIAAWRREYWVEHDGTDDVLPFAIRQDLDTMAGFVVRGGIVHDRVETVHLTWTQRKDMYWLAEGEEPTPLDLATLPSFQDWVATIMIPRSIEWMNEDDLPEMLAGTWPNAGR